MLLREYLQTNRIIADGAFGTYFSKKTNLDILPEKANESHPELVKEIHKEYLRAGARLIRTNTFASNSQNLGCNADSLVLHITKAHELAKNSIETYLKETNCNEQIFLAGDIGPISSFSKQEDSEAEYVLLADTFLSLGVDALVFETFSDYECIFSVIEQIRKKSDVFIWVSFSLNQLGMSSMGMSAKGLYEALSQMQDIDCIGFNCGVGPGHMNRIVSTITGKTDKFLSVFPNAGYPKIVRDKVVFSTNMDYFVEKVKELSFQGAHILGGCCGTSPSYIQALCDAFDEDNLWKIDARIETKTDVKIESKPVCFVKETKGAAGYAFYEKRKDSGKKLIAVELSPPFSERDEKLLETAKHLQKLDVDVVTFPDSPSGRTRADSILMSAKVKRETNVTVMPHICCRDKNAIAMRAQLLGAQINDINHFLVITGDPIPTMARGDSKGVFHFDSVTLMKMMQQMNKEVLQDKPLIFGGAINQNRLNLEVEQKRIKKKMEAGATFFFSQPIFTKEEADHLRKMKEETSARILCGVMPLISQKNALFIKNEMAGMHVTDEIVKRYEGAVSRREGEKQGILLAKDVMKMTEDFADGFYYSIPFNRGYLLEDILEGL